MGSLFFSQPSNDLTVVFIYFYFICTIQQTIQMNNIQKKQIVQVRSENPVRFIEWISPPYFNTLNN